MTHEQLVDEISSATITVLSTMIGVENEIGEAYLDTAGPGPREGVAAVVSIVGPWCGVGTVSCSASLACRLAGGMLSGEFDSVNEDVLDAMAEIANMVVGNIKTALELNLGPMQLGIPTVIYGRNFSTRSLARQNWSVVPVHCGDETLYVQMMLTQSGSHSHARHEYGLLAHAHLR